MTDSGIAIGDTAPGFELPNVDGDTHALGEPGGEAATVVYWTCNHCPYALAWHERLLDVARDYSGRGVRFLAISSNDSDRYPQDGPEAMRERVEGEGGWPHPYLYDESQDVARAYGAERTPDVFVFDRELRLGYRGAPDADYEDEAQNAAWLREAIEALLEGREPEQAETPPVGCTIKWK
ncbi:MAG: thioredoxin family protein [Solirubrobacterales bacterium]